MALFSQDDLGEDNERDNSPDFSGGEEPQDPDAVSESPVPEAVDQADGPQPAPPDDASSYGQSSDDQEPTGEFPSSSDEAEAAYSAPTDGPAQDPKSAQLPQAPVFGDWSADRAALERQYAQEAQQNVKPSVGRRILAGLAGGAVSFGGGNGAQTVQTVLNRPAQQAATQNLRQEKPLQQQLVNDQAQDTAAQRNYQNQRVAANDAALNEQRQQHADEYKQTAYEKSLKLQPTDPKDPYGDYQLVDPTGKVVATNQSPPKAITDRLEYKARQEGAEITSRQQIAIKTGLKPGSEAYNNFVFKTPMTTHTNFSIREGGTPKAPGSDANDPETIIQKNMGDKQAFADQWQRVDADHASKAFPEGSYIPANAQLSDAKAGDTVEIKKSLTPQEFQQRIDKFRTDLNANPVLRKTGTIVDENGNVVKGGGRTQPAQQPAAAQQPEAPKQIPPQQQPVTPGRPVAVDPKEKYILHNGQKAVARGGKWVYVNNGQEVK